MRKVSESAEAVVVGGGILGCCAAFHLIEAGLRRTLLLERDDLAAATSSAGAGFVGLWGAGYVPTWGEVEVGLERYGLEFYRRLAEDGYDVEYKRNGCLWAATTPEAWQRILASIAGHPAVPERRVLNPQEVERVTGIIPASAVIGGVLCPNCCQVSAPKAALATAARFSSLGGQVAAQRTVERVVVVNGRVVGVETERGLVSTEIVVLAAGAWTNVLLRELGVFAPMVPLVLARIITEPLGVPATMPTLLLPEFSTMWLREERGGLLWGTSFPAAPRQALVDRDPPRRFDQLALDGVLEVQRNGLLASHTIPLLARYRSVTVAQGAPCYTPDLRGLVGPVEGIAGLYLIGGCNEAGITHGPGYGRLLAELIVNGSAASASLDSLRLDRFGDRYANGADVVNGMRDNAMRD